MAQLNVTTQQVLIGVGVVIGVYYLASKAVPQVVTSVGAVATGEVLPEDSPYYDTGIVAVPAAAANAASGGLFAQFGSFLGRTAADIKDRLTGQGSYQEGIAK